jgi:hypothetical protein
MNERPQSFHFRLLLNGCPKRVGSLRPTVPLQQEVLEQPAFCPKSGKRSYWPKGQLRRVHLDGYDQTDLITGKGPSKRHEVLYFTEGTLSAVRIDDFKYRFTDQPGGWLGGTIKVDWPILTNLRLDPYERTGLPNGAVGSLQYVNWFTYQFWRFQFVQQEVAKLAQTAIDFPPMQKGASFNLKAVKAQIEKAVAARAGQ